MGLVCDKSLYVDLNYSITETFTNDFYKKILEVKTADIILIYVLNDSIELL